MSSTGAKFVIFAQDDKSYPNPEKENGHEMASFNGGERLDPLTCSRTRGLGTVELDPWISKPFATHLALRWQTGMCLKPLGTRLILAGARTTLDHLGESHRGLWEEPLVLGGAAKCLSRL